MSETGPIGVFCLEAIWLFLLLVHPLRIGKTLQNRLVLRPGYAFRAMVFGAVGLTGLEALVAATGGRGWHLVPLLIPIGLFLTGLLYYRTPLTLEVSDTGLTLRKGDKIPRVFAWGEIQEIRHGPKLVTTWVYAPKVSYEMTVRGRRGKIKIEEALYRPAEGSLKAIALTVAEVARNRAIPVVEQRRRLPFFLKR